MCHLSVTRKEKHQKLTLSNFLQFFYESLFLICFVFLFFLSLLLQPSSDVYVKILAGDEVIQVNDQIVVSVNNMHSTCTHVVLPV